MQRGHGVLRDRSGQTGTRRRREEGRESTWKRFGGSEIIKKGGIRASKGNGWSNGKLKFRMKRNGWNF